MQKGTRGVPFRICRVSEYGPQPEANAPECSTGLSPPLTRGPVMPPLRSNEPAELEALHLARGRNVVLAEALEELEAETQLGGERLGFVPHHRQATAPIGATRCEGADDGLPADAERLAHRGPVSLTFLRARHEVEEDRKSTR